MIPQTVLDVHDSRGGRDDEHIVTYNGWFTDGIDFEDESIIMFHDDVLSSFPIKDLDSSKFAIYKKVS